MARMSWARPGPKSRDAFGNCATSVAGRPHFSSDSNVSLIAACGYVENHTSACRISPANNDLAANGDPGGGRVEARARGQPGAAQEVAAGGTAPARPLDLQELQRPLPACDHEPPCGSRQHFPGRSAA